MIYTLGKMLTQNKLKNWHQTIIIIAAFLTSIYSKEKNVSLKTVLDRAENNY